MLEATDVSVGPLQALIVYGILSFVLAGFGLLIARWTHLGVSLIEGLFAWRAVWLWAWRVLARPAHLCRV